MQASAAVFGCDVSSAWLDINRYGETDVRRLGNDRGSIDAWLARIPPGSLLGLEATGRYHQQLARQAQAAGLVVYVLNPRDVHHYARGMGRRAKTDRVDAQLLARFVAHEHRHLRAWQASSPAQDQVQALLRHRGKLVKLKQALKMTGQGLSGVETPLAHAEASLQALIDGIEAQVQALVAQHGEDERGRQRVLQSIDGIGPLTATYLWSLFTRVAFTRSDQVVSFLGLDLSFADSGKKQGRRRLSKRGPAEARRLLYNAAAAAGRGVFKPLLDHYRQRLPYTGAVMALARKLVRIAFAVWRSGEAFDSNRYASPFLGDKA